MSALTGAAPAIRVATRTRDVGAALACCICCKMTGSLLTSTSPRSESLSTHPDTPCQVSSGGGSIGPVRIVRGAAEGEDGSRGGGCVAGGGGPLVATGKGNTGPDPE